MSTHRVAPTIVVTSGLVALFVAFAYTLYATGALVFTGSESSAKVVSATIALIGAFVAGIVSLMGMSLKHSLDERTEARQQAESERNALYQREAESRLKLEAAIKAITLIGADGESDGVRLQRAGVLLTLSSLGQHGLALALIELLLEQNGCEPSTIAAVADKALQSSDVAAQRDAIAMIAMNAEKLLTDSGCAFPSCLTEPVAGRDRFIREWTVIAVAKLFVARPRVAWQSTHIFTAYALIATLCRLWTAEPESDLKTNVGATLRAVLEGFPLMAFVGTGQRRVEIKPFRQLPPAPSGNDAFLRAVVELQRWSAESKNDNPSA
jgi:hypothetical protein